jgi:hypothetical protein
MSTVPAAVFETSAVLAKLLGAVVVDVVLDDVVDDVVIVAGVFVDELPELPPPHAASVSALAPAASSDQ